MTNSKKTVQNPLNPRGTLLGLLSFGPFFPSNYMDEFVAKIILSFDSYPKLYIPLMKKINIIFLSNNMDEFVAKII